MTTVTTNFSKEHAAEKVLFKREDGGAVAFTNEEIDLCRRVVENTWYSMADDMFINDMGERDESMTFTRYDVMEFGIDAGRYEQVLAAGEDFDKMKVIREKLRDLGWGSDGWVELVKVILPTKIWGW
jgi:hypothetical protein